MSYWLSGTEKLGAQIFAVTLWKTWYARNQMVFKNEKPNPRLIADAVRSFVAGFNEANPQSQTMQNISTAVPHVQSHLGSYVSVDGGTFHDDKAGLGMTIRNQQGDLTFAACRSFVLLLILL